MKTLNEIKNIIDRKREELTKRFNIKYIYIFGSYVRNEQNEKSDLDILVEFNSPVSLLHIISLENYLSDLLGLKVDVVPKKNIRKELKEKILKEAILI